MVRRVELLLCVVLVGLATLWSIEPRFDVLFPSMIDDWSGIAKAPDQLHEILRLGNPEPDRYRPGFIIWNALQWHTLGAPGEFIGPQVWGVLRWLVLVLGTTLLAAVVVANGAGGAVRRLDGRWLLVAGVPLIAVTAPSLAIDLARFGPQEPLLVGCMALGAVLLLHVFNRLLGGDARSWPVATAAAGGLLLWGFGVLQKETSICVLLLAPFLWPTVRAQRDRWSLLAGRRRLAIGLVAGGVLLPFVPMLVRTIELALAENRIYEGAAAGKSLTTRVSDQLGQASDILHSPLPMIVLGAAVVLLSVRSFRLGADWLATGFLVVAFAFILFAAEVGVVASRYYLPAFVLGALALARSALPLGSRVVLATGAIVVVGGLWQVWEANGWVEWWRNGERDREALVREAASREAGGCRVDTIGLNVELVQALPVLAPLADEPPRGCATGDRFVVVIDPGGSGTETPATDPVLVACAPEPTADWSSHIGKILRCTA